MDVISKDTLPILHNKMLAGYLQFADMHITFSLFLAKEKKEFMELTETLNWLHIFMTNILLSLNSKTINTSIFSILNNRYLQKCQNVKIIFVAEIQQLITNFETRVQTTSNPAVKSPAFCERLPHFERNVDSLLHGKVFRNIPHLSFLTIFLV